MGSGIFDLFLHLDRHLEGITQQYGIATYLILFAIVFAETGFVVTPFLPGDSLLFMAGAIAAKEWLSIGLLYLLFPTAALAGDNVNYWVGRFLGPRLFRNEKSRLFRRAHLDKTHRFFERHGGKTVIMARFVPIVRTFAPFVAGMGAMTYGRFLLFSVLGALLWVGVCVTAGYFFGSHPFVKSNFSLVVLAIIFLSLLPAIAEFISHRRAAGRAAPVPAVERE